MKWNKWQREAQKSTVADSHDHAKIPHECAKWTRMWICVTDQGEFASWFRMIMQKFLTVMQNGLGSYGCCYCSIDFAQPCKISFLHVNWLSLCEMIVLLLNSWLLNGKASKRALRWCQVSTWPSLINRNLNLSLKNF